LEFGIGETPVETPFMASEVSEFVKRVALGDWNLDFGDKKSPDDVGTFIF
jgi:hypothetical protein